MPAVADPEQLLGLGFHALGRVNQHDGAVRRHQGAVRVFRKVLMPGRIQNIDTEPLVIKLQHRRGNGDPALLFNFHPVGYGMLVCLSGFYTACQMDGAAV